MPNIGDVCSGGEIGMNSGLYTWLACPVCHKPRWVKNTNIKMSKSNCTCKPCSMKLVNERCGNDGKILINKTNYVMIRLPHDSPYISMANKNSRYCFEHRIVMAQHLGRCLQPFEIVHHKNGIKYDNRIENLELTMQGAHSKTHSKGYTDGYLKGYREGFNKAMNEKITKLNQEIRLLQLQLKGQL